MIHLEKDMTYAVAANSGAFLAAVWDVTTRRIPNALVLGVVIVGLALHLSFDGWHGAAAALLSGCVAGAIFFAFFCAGGLGGGDVKLMAAIATAYGFSRMPYLLILTTLAGGAMALALALWHGRLQQTLRNVATIASHHADQGLVAHGTINVKNAASLRLPYGVAVAAGCLLVAVGRG